MELTQIINIVIILAYFVVAGGLLFFAIFGVYALIKYGRTPSITVAVSTVFGIIFIGLMIYSVNSLQNILL